MSEWEIERQPIKCKSQRIQELVIQLSDAKLELTSLREEVESLKKSKHHDNYVIENQKYQLGKWAKENEELTEEVNALRIIARKYLKAVE
jgi:hypothetical protein